MIIDVSVTEGHVFIDPQQNPLSHLLSSSAPMKSKPCDAREKEAPRATTGWKLFADVCGRRCHVTSCDNCLEAALELRTSGSGNIWK